MECNCDLCWQKFELIDEDVDRLLKKKRIFCKKCKTIPNYENIKKPISEILKKLSKKKMLFLDEDEN